VPSLVAPELPAGRLARLPQPTLSAPGAPGPASTPVTVRPWGEADVPAVVDAYADPAIQQWHARSMTPDEARAWVAHWPGRWAEESGAGWAVEVDGAVVGQVSLRRVWLAEASAEISYWVLPHARGRGIAPVALDAVTRWVLAEVGLLRTSLAHSTRNPASCRVASKAGYEPEGTLRRQARHADGWHDMHVHARLAEG
jgi:ribosomal-protein-alanine N-acetyltransferase